MMLNNFDVKKLKTLNYEQKKSLASEIRQFLIKNIAITGGHLSSNLGIVELVIGIHSVINSGDDIIIFDVGHQSYTHKILTNRANMFPTLRKKNGLSGFISTEESVHDVWESGHSSTSISAGIAYALANPNKQICIVIGDSSIVNGVSLEAINHLGELDLKNVTIILNDNDMSISTPTGGFSKQLHKINDDTVNTLSHFNVQYFGPYDGHNIEKIENVLKSVISVKNQRSSIVHFKTKKGKGYVKAEEDKLGNWHGVGKFGLEQNQVNKEEKILWSQVISNQVELLMNIDEKICVTTPAMALGSKLINIANKYPHRFFDVGISEEHAVCFNAALAESKKFKPFLSIYSSFLQRGYDFLLTDLVRKNNHVVVGIDRCGFVGEDGPTHHGVWDVSFLKTLPNTTIFAPRDATSSFEMLKYAFAQKQGLFAIRYEKQNVFANFDHSNLDVKEIDWEILQPLKKVNVLSFGRCLRQIQKIEGTTFGLIDACVLNKVNNDIIYMLQDTELVIVEEIIENNSLYEQIVKFCFENDVKIKLHKICVDNPFAKQATQVEQLEDENLTSTKIKEVILRVYDRLEK